MERGESSAMSQNSSLMSGVDCLLDTCEQFNSFFSATLAATSSSFSTLDWLIRPFLGGVKESRFTRSPALSCGETHVKITLDRFTRLDLRDSQIGNTWLAFSGREASLLVPQGGPEALLPLQGGSRDRQGGPVRHLYDQRF